MTITIDTNVLVRLIVDDDPHQTRAARAEVVQADKVLITTIALCETAWVLKSRYGFERTDIAAAIQVLLAIPSVVADRSIVEAALAHLRSGGDFADGIIAADGRSRGGETFVSFDQQAVRRLTKSGVAARIPQAANP